MDKNTEVAPCTCGFLLHMGDTGSECGRSFRSNLKLSFMIYTVLMKWRCYATWNNCSLWRNAMQPQVQVVDGELVVEGYSKPGEIPMLNRKIARGTRVTILEHPYMASIRRHMAHYLTGALVGSNLVVTVAHPLVNVPVTELNVVLSQTYNDRGTILFTVILVIIHPEYDPNTLYADLALLRVYETIQYRLFNLVMRRYTVKPVRSILDEKFKISRPVSAFVTGWGRCDVSCEDLCLPRGTSYHPGEITDPMLKSVNIYVTDDKNSCTYYNDLLDIRVPQGNLCGGAARIEAPGTPCLAVPGAPLVVSGKLLGVLSWGFGCGFEKDLPLVFIDVRFYYKWLQNTIKVLSRIRQTNYTLLFETTRATILYEWLERTRTATEAKPHQHEQILQPWDIDLELCTVYEVFDIRDYYATDDDHRAEKKSRCEAEERRKATFTTDFVNTTVPMDYGDENYDKHFQQDVSDSEHSDDADDVGIISD